VVLVLGPVVHEFQRAFEVATQEVADGEFRGAEGGEVFQCLHGGIEGVAAVAGDVVRQAHADESAVEAGGEFAQDFEGIFVVQRQHGVQAFADAGHALHHRQFRQPLVGVLEKRLGLERRVHGAHFAGDVLQAFGVEDFL